MSSVLSALIAVLSFLAALSTLLFVLARLDQPLKRRPVPTHRAALARAKARV